VTDSSTDDHGDVRTEEIHTEISTEVSNEGQGTVYAVQTVQQGDRRVDCKIGHVDRIFAEGAEYYYKGEVFHTDALTQLPENAPRGRYKDDTFHELIDSDSSIEDGKLTETFVYDLDGVDTAEWAKEYFDGQMQMLPETLLEEWWEDKKSRYEEENEIL